MNKLLSLFVLLIVLSISLTEGFVSPQRMISNIRNLRNTFGVKTSTRLFAETSSVPTLQTIASDKKKLGVLLLNLGGPEKLEDVEGFLFNLFADPDIIRLPKFLSFLQKPIAFFISKTRSMKARKAYGSIGGGSPIVKYTREQTELLQAALQSTPGYEETRCYFGMRYWHPFTEAVLAQMQSDGIEKLVVLPLYPQYSISTTGSSLRCMKEYYAAHPTSPLTTMPQTVIPYWYHRPEYIQTVAKLIVEKIQAFTPEELAVNEGELHVLFSAHGVPEYYITRENDPYQLHIQECTQLIEAEVRRRLSTGNHHHHSNHPLEVHVTSTPHQQSPDQQPHNDQACPTIAPTKLHFHLSFQSRVGPIKWLQPYTEDMLTYLGTKQGVKNLVVIPISFVSEHIETLEEIDQEYQEIAHEKGILNWKRVPALNLDPQFIATLKNVVVDAVEKYPLVSIQEALNLKNMQMYKAY